MKTFISLAAAMLLFCSTVFAQSTFKGKVTGVIQESPTKALPFATVLLLNAKDSTLAKGAISSESGNYEFENVSLGRYLVSATMVGYQKALSSVFEISTTQPSFTVPALRVTENTQTLQEVKIVSKKPFVEQQIDRMVVNVENNIGSAGGTALEVLEKAPGVTVDRQNDRLQFKGRQGVMVMIDGKLQQISMPATT
jgi:hypothetical protein